MHRSLALNLILLTMLLAFAAGCNSDPYCQQAISNLRAEKIQLENEFYALKSLYESQLGPVPANEFYDSGNSYLGGTGFDSSPITGSTPGSDMVPQSYSPPSFAQGEIIYQDDQPVSRQTNHSGDVGQFLRTIEVSQIDGRPDEIARLLIQPLDDRGDVLPLEGDVKVRLVDPANRTTVAEYEFNNKMTINWIQDSGAMPGIHLRLPREGRSINAQRLICDIQYRHGSRPILKQKTELILNQQQAAVRSNTPTLARPTAINAATSSRQGNSNQGSVIGNRTGNSPAQLRPDDLGGTLNIEFGDELNFESLGAGSTGGETARDSSSLKRPKWQPDR